MDAHAVLSLAVLLAALLSVSQLAHSAPIDQAGLHLDATGHDAVGYSSHPRAQFEAAAGRKLLGLLRRRRAAGGGGDDDSSPAGGDDAGGDSSGGGRRGRRGGRRARRGRRSRGGAGPEAGGDDAAPEEDGAEGAAEGEAAGESSEDKRAQRKERAAARREAKYAARGAGVTRTSQKGAWNGTEGMREFVPGDLTPPDYCFTTVDGRPATPTVAKVRNPPSAKVATQIAAMLGKPRPCMLLSQTCAKSDRNVDGGGKPFHPRYFGGTGLTAEQMIEKLPDLKPGDFGSCAVVGNADNVFKTPRGSEIDAHDFVIRFNVKIKGFDKAVGKKTTGLWTKPNYNLGPLKGDQKPERYHICPKTTPASQVIGGKPALNYGPDARSGPNKGADSWGRTAAKIYEIYKKEKKIKAGKPTGGWMRMMAVAELVQLGICNRLDIYGYSSGGGKYFRRSFNVKDAHVINIEHYSHRLLMATGVKGKVCVYGD